MTARTRTDSGARDLPHRAETVNNAKLPSAEVPSTQVQPLVPCADPPRRRSRSGRGTQRCVRAPGCGHCPWLCLGTSSREGARWSVQGPGSRRLCAAGIPALPPMQAPAVHRTKGDLLTLFTTHPARACGRWRIILLSHETYRWVSLAATKLLHRIISVEPGYFNVPLRNVSLCTEQSVGAVCRRSPAARECMI